MADKKKNIKLKKNMKLPVKRTINLAFIGQKRINLLIAIPSIVLIIAAAAVFSKFGVLDRLNKVEALRAEENRLQADLDQVYDELKVFDEVTDEYEHYTYTGMTFDELTRPDRMEAVKLLNEKVFPFVKVDNWTLQNDMLVVPMKGETLEQINTIAASLEADKRVNFCTVTDAVTEELTKELYVPAPPKVNIIRNVKVVTKEVVKPKETEPSSDITENELIEDAAVIEPETVIEYETETEIETEIETEPQTEIVYVTETWVKGNVTCFLNLQETQYASAPVQTEGGNADENIEP